MKTIVTISRDRGNQPQQTGWMYFNVCSSLGQVQPPADQLQVSGFEYLVEFQTKPRSRK